MFRIVLLLGLVATVFATSAHAEFKAGAAFRVVTPDPLLPVSGGVGGSTPATIKNDDLTVRAVVFDRDGERVAFVGVDFLGFNSVLANKARAKVPGIPADHILIGATHCHSAPDTYGFPDPTGKSKTDLAYLDFVCDKIAEALNEAVSRLQPAQLKIAMDEAKGKIAYNYYAPQLYDPRCCVIQAVATADGGPVAKDANILTVVNYAIHPEVIGDSQGMLGPDLCGPLYHRIEEKGGGMGIFMNGAQGGMITADNRTEGGEDARTWEECVRIGQLLADEALRIVAEAAPQADPGLHVEARQIAFPIDSPLLRFVLKSSPIKGELTADGRVPTTLNLVNLGTAQILTIPGEALPNIGYYVKRHMNTEQPMLFGLTNDAFGYILTKVDFMSFKRYDYVSRTSLGEMTGEIYMEEALKLVSESPKPDGQ